VHIIDYLIQIQNGNQRMAMGTYRYSKFGGNVDGISPAMLLKLISLSSKCSKVPETNLNQE
jgi:hypothetical protein